MLALRASSIWSLSLMSEQGLHSSRHVLSAPPLCHALPYPADPLPFLSSSSMFLTQPLHML